MRLRQSIAVISSGLVAAAIGFAPVTASACGFKRFNTGRQPSFSQTYTASVKGSVLIYKNAVDSRMEATLRSSGYTVARVDSLDNATKGSVVLVPASGAPDIQGKGLVMVEVDPKGTSETGGTKFVIRESDEINSRLAVVANAVKSANGA